MVRRSNVRRSIASGEIFAPIITLGGVTDICRRRPYCTACYPASMPTDLPSSDRASAALSRAQSDPRWTPAGWQFAQSLEPDQLLLLADVGRLKTAIPIINVIAERAPETGRQVTVWIECGLLIHAPVVVEYPELVELAMLRVAAEVLPAEDETQRQAALESISDELASMREKIDFGELRYSIAAEDDSFVAHWLDGEVTSDGPTEAEAIASLREAIALYRAP